MAKSPRLKRMKHHSHSEAKGAANDWQPRFITALKKHQNVTAAAEECGYSRRHVYRTRKEDPEFAQKWNEAWESLIDSLEQSMLRRATAGYMEPVWQNGKLMGHKVVHHPATGIFMLKHNRPEKYAEPLAGGVNTPEDYVKAVQAAFNEQDKLAEEALKAQKK